MNRLFRSLAFMIALPLMAPVPALSASLMIARDAVRAAAQAAFVVERQPTLAPMGQVHLCMNRPAMCLEDAVGSPIVAANAVTLRLLQVVNDDVNGAIVSRRDEADDWSVAPPAGDCEDYALTKRVKLIAMGFPAAALRLAVALTPTGETHAVLVVRTSDGDLVLDNRVADILRVPALDLTLVAIQSGRRPDRWFTL